MLRVLATLGTALLLAWTHGCAGNKSVSGPGGNVTTNHEVDRMVQREVPIGTSADNARSVMEKEGFTCTFKTNDVLRYHTVEPDGSTAKHVLTDVDFVLCNRSQQDGLVTSIKSIAFVIKDCRVDQVISMNSFVGP